MTDHRQLLTTQVAYSPMGVAALTGLKYSTVLNLVHTGQLRARQAGRGYIISSGALIDYLNGAD